MLNQSEQTEVRRLFSALVSGSCDESRHAPVSVFLESLYEHGFPEMILDDPYGDSMLVCAVYPMSGKYTDLQGLLLRYIADAFGCRAMVFPETTRRKLVGAILCGPMDTIQQVKGLFSHHCPIMLEAARDDSVEDGYRMYGHIVYPASTGKRRRNFMAGYCYRIYSRARDLALGKDVIGSDSNAVLNRAAADEHLRRAGLYRWVSEELAVDREADRDRFHGAALSYHRGQEHADHTDLLPAT